MSPPVNGRVAPSGATAGRGAVVAVVGVVLDGVGAAVPWRDCSGAVVPATFGLGPPLPAAPPVRTVRIAGAAHTSAPVPAATAVVRAMKRRREIPTGPVTLPA